MLEIGKVNAAAPVYAEGRVTLEYTDGLTGRVKERVQGKNHVFPGGMMLGGLPYLLGNNDVNGTPLAIYLSDYAGALDSEIPLIPGNIIGYGTVGSAATGKYLGVENTAARSLGVYSAGKFHYKRQWSWAPAQVPGVIRKIGLSPRLTEIVRSYYNNVLFNPLPVAFTFTSPSSGLCNYDDGLYTRFFNEQYAPSTVLASQYAFGSVVNTNLTWAQLVAIDDYYNGALSYGHTYWCVDTATRELHLFYIYWSTEKNADNKNLYKLLHAWFDATLSQRKGQETTVIGPAISKYGFTGNSQSGAVMGLLSGGVYYLPHALDGTTPSWCAFDPEAAGGGDWNACFTKQADFFSNSCYSEKGVSDIGYYYHEVEILGNQASISLVGLSTNNRDARYVYLFRGVQPYALKVLSYANNGYYDRDFHGLIPRDIGGTRVLAAYRAPSTVGEAYADSNEMWCNFSDLCCYSLPADAPARQEGQGVSVTYELAVGY